MEYNFLADFLAKFSSFSDPIKATTLFIIGAVFISFFHFLKQIILSITELLLKKRLEAREVNYEQESLDLMMKRLMKDF